MWNVLSKVEPPCLSSSSEEEIAERDSPLRRSLPKRSPESKLSEAMMRSKDSGEGGSSSFDSLEPAAEKRKERAEVLSEDAGFSEGEDRFRSNKKKAHKSKSVV